MYGVFGAYTSWTVAFLVIFVLVFLLVPADVYGSAGTAATATAAVY